MPRAFLQNRKPYRRLEMIAYIKGRLEHKDENYIVIEANGIGYKVFTALSTVERIGREDTDIKVYTHLYVREDMMSLYGFMTREELGMFELLISVAGVGPKAAVSVISGMSPSKFGLAVITDDVKTLTKAQGIGNKTAQRIILELKDKISKQQEVFANNRANDGVETVLGDNRRVSEAISALMVLGYTPLEASRAVASVYSEELELESIIRDSLKNIGR
jgi:holliday junction DNA helicase RuvA